MSRPTKTDYLVAIVGPLLTAIIIGGVWRLIDHLVVTWA